MAKNQSKPVGGSVEIGGTRVPLIFIAGAAGVGLVLFLLNRNQSTTSGGTLGADQTSADLNSTEELRGRVDAGLLRLDDLIRRFQDSLDEATPGPVIVPDPLPESSPQTPKAPPDIRLDPNEWNPPSFPTPVSPTNPLTQEQVAVPGVDYDPNGLGALIGDIGGPIQINGGKYIVTDNWTLQGLPAAFDPFGKDPTPVVTRPPVSKA